MDEIKICSLNCQGLGDPRKRRDVLHYLREKNFSIICLQDTHFTKDIEKIVSNEWGYKVYFNSFNSRSRGVAIFFRNNFEFKVHNTFKDNSGNVLILDLEVENQRITLVNIYGPNNDEPSFYDKLQNSIHKFGNNNIMIVGDWNLLLNPDIDGTNYKHINNPNARQKVLKLMSDLNLYDVWREENLEKKLFTWKRKIQPRGIQMGRLDFFLISQTLINYSSNESILPGYRSDHSIISLTLQFSKIPRTKTFWKFNSSLLSNPNFIKEIKNVFSNVKKQYAASPYNLEKIDEVDNSNFETTINPQLFLEVILLESRSKTIAFSSAIKKNYLNLEKDLETQIKDLENNDPENNIENLKMKKDQLQLIREKKLKGTLIRSRARWVEQGEKGSRYFCNLENRNFVSKRMSSLLDKDGNEITDFDKINNEVLQFYQKLYSSKENDIEDVDLNARLKENTPKLSNAEAVAIEGQITIKEAGLTLKNMQNNKSPGSTGFTVEFFKFFWKDLGHFIVRSLNYGFQMGELSTTQKEGIITCIPKGNKSKKYIKNWRPISLLNISYKIGSGCIASRIKKVLPSIIDLDQTGFMSDRFTGDNIRLIYDTLNFSKIHKQRGLLLLIDFEKAFDSVAWSFIEKTLTYYNFKNDIISWIKTFYKGIKSTVIVNNKPTPWFPIERGCRQGDPISPYIFLLCGEILAHMIRQNADIKGYPVIGKEVLMSQFADDASLLLDGSQESFEACVFTILEYAKYSGLAMNFDKTKVVWFGCENPPNTKYLSHLPFEWNPETFTILGVEFTKDLENISDINIRKKLTEMQHDLNNWSKRDLTPFGKVIVLKTLIVSKIVNILISLPTPSTKLLNEINDMFYKFLWDGKPDKMRRSLSKQKIINGGIGMIDIKLFDKSLKLTWIRRFFKCQSRWKELITEIYPCFGDIHKFGNVFLENFVQNIDNPFWSDVMNYFLSFNEHFIMRSKEEILSCSFLCNKNIKVGDRVITNRTFINKDIFYIKQLMRGDTFLTHGEFIQQYNAQIQFLNFTSIISAVKSYVSKNVLPSDTNKTISYQPALNFILSTTKGASIIYHSMLQPDGQNKGFQKWSLHTQISLENWKNSFKILKQCTHDTKLRWLQFRILHNILTTNRSVAKFKPEQNPLCQFCKSHSETIYHLLWQCNKVKIFWNDLSHIMNNRCTNTHNFKIDENLALFGQSENIKTDKICEFIILLAKFYIYRSKVQDTVLNIRIFIRELHTRYIVEKEIHQNSASFKNDWLPYTNIFRSLL